MDHILLLAAVGCVQCLVLLAQILLVLQYRREMTTLRKFREESRSTLESMHRIMMTMNLRSLRDDVPAENVVLERAEVPTPSKQLNTP